MNVQELYEKLGKIIADGDGDVPVVTYQNGSYFEVERADVSYSEYHPPGYSGTLYGKTLDFI